MRSVIAGMSFKSWAAAGMAAIGLVSFVGRASATPVYDTDIGLSDYSGSRSIAGGGLINGGGTFTSATLSWTITPEVGFLHYSYALNTDSKQGISHFILDLSDDCTAIGDCFQNLVINSGGTLGEIEFDTFSTAQGGSNPGMLGPITGVKANISSGGSNIAWEFDSNRTPVWEDFYSKGGNPDGGAHQNGYAVFNAGLSFEATDSDTGHFVPMPDSVACTADCTGPGGNKIPEPSTTALLGAGLLGFAFFGRRRQQARRRA